MSNKYEATFHPGDGLTGAREAILASIGGSPDWAVDTAPVDALVAAQVEAAVSVARAEVERLRALVGDENQPGWGGCSRAEAIRQANEFHAGQLRWMDEHDKRRAERDEARAGLRALREKVARVETLMTQWEAAEILTVTMRHLAAEVRAALSDHPTTTPSPAEGTGEANCRHCSHDLTSHDRGEGQCWNEDADGGACGCSRFAPAPVSSDEAHITQWGIELTDGMTYGVTPSTREEAERCAVVVPGAKVREVRNCDWAGVTLYDAPAPVSSGEAGKR